MAELDAAFFTCTASIATMRSTSSPRSEASTIAARSCPTRTASPSTSWPNTIGSRGNHCAGDGICCWLPPLPDGAARICKLLRHRDQSRDRQGAQGATGSASAVIRSVFEHPDTAEASGTPPKDQAVTEHYVAQFRFVYGTHVQYNAKSELFRGSAVPALPGVLVFDN